VSTAPEERHARIGRLLAEILFVPRRIAADLVPGILRSHEDVSHNPNPGLLRQPWPVPGAACVSPSNDLVWAGGATAGPDPA
jgi:hypothetical protein